MSAMSENPPLERTIKKEYFTSFLPVSVLIYYTREVDCCNFGNACNSL